MDQWRKYASARNQVYHVGVVWRSLQERFPAKHRTPQLLQVLEIIETVIDTAQKCFDAGQVMGVQIDVYEPIFLPGLEELMKDKENPYKMHTD